MGSKSEFDKLKEQWIQAGRVGYKRTEEELLRMIEGWINVMNGNVDQKYLDMGRIGCEHIKINDQDATKEEKAWCALIVGEILKIRDKMNDAFSRNTVNVKIADYIECAIRKLWFHLYKRMYCNAEEVIKLAFGAMDDLCEHMAQDRKCEKCEYGRIAVVHVGGANIYGLIFNKMSEDGGLSDRMYNELPKVTCYQQQQQQQQQQLSKFATATSVGNPFLMKLLLQWIWVNGDPTKGVNKGIWVDLKNVVDDMMKNIQEDGHNDKGHCSTLGEGKVREKELCKIVARMLLWMDGLKQEHEAILPASVRYTYWVKRGNERTPEKEILQSYYRCLLGNVTMLNMLGKHCSFNEVVQTAKSGAESIRLSVGDTGPGNVLCKGVDVGSLNLAGKLIWEQVSQWINEYKWEGNKSLGLLEVIRGHSRLHRVMRRGNSCPGQREKREIRRGTLKTLEIKANDGEGVNLQDERQSGGMEELNKVLEGVEGKKKGENENVFVQRVMKLLEERLEQHMPDVQRNKAKSTNERTQVLNQPRSEPTAEDFGLPKVQSLQTPSEPKGIDCIKGEFCNRIKCVARKWWWNREKNKVSFNGNWLGKFWDTDVKGELGRLSGDILKEREHMEQYCSDFSDANKKACEFITAGLKHIYSIKQESGDKDKEDKQSPDNKIFKQTMSCVLLNAFADKIIELTKGQPCGITEEIITKAFSKGNGQIYKWCTDKSKGDCVECKRDKNYATCTVEDSRNQTNVKGKANELLNGKHPNLTKTLSTINTTLNSSLCERAQCVTVKWFANRMEKGGRQNWCTFWKEKDVGKVLRDLSKAMTSKSTSVDNLCEDIKVADQTKKDANKKVCEFIVRGLKHTYEINEYGTWKDAGAPKKKKDNQQFYRTIGCAFLNVYADRIKYKCQAAEAGINFAFSKSEQIKNETDPCKSDGNCVTCTREKNFKCTLNVKDDLLNKGKSARCEGDRQNIHKKLGEMLDPTTNRDGQVQDALPKLNKICPDQPAATKTPTSAKPATPSPGKSAPPSKKKPTEEECENRMVDDGVDITACLDMPDDLPTVPPVTNLNEKHEADHMGFTVGERGSKIGEINITKGTTQLSSEPTTPTDPDSQAQTPSTGREQNQTSSSSTGTSQGVGGPKGDKGDPVVPTVHNSLGPSTSLSGSTTTKGRGGAEITPLLPARLSHTADHPNFAPYLPTIPFFIGISAMSYLLWKYFFFGKRRKRHRRAHQVSGPPTLEEQLLAHMDQHDGPHEYVLVKERKQLRSTPKRRRKKRAVRRCGCVRRRMIIDIHLEVLDECQKGDTKLVQEDFFEILVQEFMGSKFIKEENIPKEQVSMVDVPKEHVLCSDSGFLEGRLSSYRSCS